MTDTAAKPDTWWRPLLALVKHVFPGVGVFILLAIPAIALDFFNQGIELIEIQRAAAAGVIKVSGVVKWTLHLVEYFILLVDVVFVVVTLINGMWQYVVSLKWKNS